MSTDECIDGKKYHVVDIENDHGLVGVFGLSKEEYDEHDMEELAYMIMRVTDVWIKRREFIHANIAQYERLC